jgi:hypothetical protein
MGGCFGSAAFDGARIYVGCSNGLVALNYNSTTHDFSVAWTAGGGFADSPIVAGGAVWYPDRAHAQLKAVDAATGALRFAFSAAANHFATPAAGDGKVFLSLSNSVVAYSMGTATPVAGNGSTTYTLDGYGGVHPAGTAPVEIAGPSWSCDIARGLAVFSDGSGGYVLDGWGAAHPFAVSGGSLPPTPAGPYFPNFDIARAIALAPWATSANPAGWILDGWGGVHPFGSAPSVGPTAYWPNWDIARGLVILGDSTPSSVKGYTLDGWGGLHPFGGAPAAAGLAYWPNWDIARGVALLPGTTSAGPVKGYTLDGWGGVHPFGGAPAVAGAYWPNWDIARGITLWDSGSGGWTLDGWGGLHAFGGAPTLSATAYTVGHDIFRACSSGGGQGPAESGGRHYP